MIYGTADIETLATNSDCVILAVAMVCEDLTKPFTLHELVNRAFYSKLDARDQIERFGRHISKETLAFWKKQPPVAREVLIPKEDDQTLEDMYIDLKQWFRDRGVDSQDIPFGARGYLDFSALVHVWERHLGLVDMKDHPIPHYNVEEIRTALKYLGQDRYAGMEPDEVEGFIHHNCVHDAALDWLRIQKALVEVGGIEIV